MTIHVSASLVNYKPPEDGDYVCLLSEPLIPQSCLSAALCLFMGASPPWGGARDAGGCPPQGRLQTITRRLIPNPPLPHTTRVILARIMP